MNRARFLALACAAGLTLPAVASSEELRGHVVFARGTSLWLTDPRGKGPAVEIAALPGPAAEVRMIRSDATGAVLLVDHGGRWYTAAVPAPGQVATLTERPCAGAPARLSPTGVHLLCADADGHAQLVRLRDGKVFRRDAAMGRGATVTEHDGQRELVSVDDDGVVGTLVRDPEQRRVLSPLAPTRDLLASPDGHRAVGIFHEVSPHKDGPARDHLMTFPLDGSGARRHLLRDAVAIDWSWNGAWLLVQAGGKACIARGVGGQYKCWNGYTAVSVSPDGEYALVLGPRATDAAPIASPSADEPESPEGGDDHVVDSPEDVAAPPGPLSLFRARVGGAYTETPALVETAVDGAALWLPAPSAAVTAR